MLKEALEDYMALRRMYSHFLDSNPRSAENILDEFGTKVITHAGESLLSLGTIIHKVNGKSHVYFDETNKAYIFRGQFVDAASALDLAVYAEKKAMLEIAIESTQDPEDTQHLQTYAARLCREKPAVQVSYVGQETSTKPQPTNIEFALELSLEKATPYQKHMSAFREKNEGTDSQTKRDPLLPLTIKF